MSGEIRVDRARMGALLLALERMAGGELEERAPISCARDELDALAHGINVLAGELVYRLRELQSAQASLVESARLASLGQVSAGLAHELNNPLALLQGYTEMTRDLLAEAARGEPWDPDTAAHYLDRIEASVERMSAIIRHVKEFSRQSAHARQPVCMNDVVRRSFVLLSEQLRLDRIDVELRLAPDLPVVVGDAVRLEQVLVNLLTNARDAIVARGGGRGRVEVVTARAPGGVEISVSDDGAGMPPEVLAEAFTPFYTTKEPGKGTGLGLSIAHGIVAEHGGQVFGESWTGRGTRFVVRLPAGQA